jgi:hypothetical protein
VIGTTLLAAPVAGVRVVGGDSATAHRVSWLSRMLAGRDVALAVGALTAEARGRDSSGWIAAGAAADAVDAVALGVALREGRLGGGRAAFAAGVAVLAAGIGLWAARTPHTSRRS